MTGPDRRRTARRLALGLLLLGVLAVVVLVAGTEWGGLLAAFTRLGLGGFALILALHCLLIALMGWAWAQLGGASALAFLRARLLRDGAAEVLPLSQLGGFVLGGRALVLAGATPGFAAAATIVDVTLELVAQLGYTAIGLALLVWLNPSSRLAVPALAAILAMALLVAGFAVVQARGAGPAARAVLRFARMAGLLDDSAAPQTAEDSLQSRLTALHAAPRRLAACLALHLASWLLVGAETWLICHLLGAPIALSAALVIDSLLSGLRSAAFMVPQSMGVQEGGYMLLGAQFGLSPEIALALSLTRRARDLVIGAPVLLVWQIAEGRRALRRG